MQMQYLSLVFKDRRGVRKYKAALVVNKITGLARTLYTQKLHRAPQNS